MFQSSTHRTINRSRKKQLRRRKRAAANSTHLLFEPLEHRAMLTTFLVNTADDDPSAGSTDTDGYVSLREAITAANTNSVFGDATTPGQGGGVVDAIGFAPSLGGQTIVLGGAQLVIGDDLSISGLGQDDLMISGDDASRVFMVESDVSVALSSVTIANGSATDGGGIYNLGTLTVANSRFTNNTAETDGGAIDNLGSLTVTDSTISNNWATYGGAIVSWTLMIDSPMLSISGTTISNNYADYQGGGIWTDGVLEIVGGTVSGNSTDGSGAGIYTRDGGQVTVRGTDFIGNTSRSSGGAISNAGGFVYDNASSLDVADCTFSGNSASSGAGIWNEGPASVTNSNFSDNHVRNWGGAIANNIRTMTITNSTFTGNSAGAYSGAVDNSFGGTMHIADSLLSGNTAGREGGAIENYFGTMTIRNSTISGNSSNGTGGGVWNLGPLELTNLTIVLNRADADGDGSGDGGGLYHETSSYYADPLQNNTIVAGNTLGAEGADSPDDIFGLLAPTSAHNLIGDAGTSGGLIDGINDNIIGNSGIGTIDITTVLVTNLGDNGGPTLTHALVAGSPAIDAGDNSLAVDGDGNPLLYDQRGVGFARIVGGTVDIGAYEVQPQIVQIDIDVKQGSDSNPINLASQGVIAVTILTTDDFDAASVDSTTVVFAGASAVHSALEDVDGDGDLDMVLHFQVQQTNLADVYSQLIEEDADSNHQSVSVSLEGETINDEVFAGTDDADLFLSGKALRELLEELAEAGVL